MPRGLSVYQTVFFGSDLPVQILRKSCMPTDLCLRSESAVYPLGEREDLSTNGYPLGERANLCYRRISLFGRRVDLSTNRAIALKKRACLFGYGYIFANGYIPTILPMDIVVRRARRFVSLKARDLSDGRTRFNFYQRDVSAGWMESERSDLLPNGSMSYWRASHPDILVPRADEYFHQRVTFNGYIRSKIARAEDRTTIRAARCVSPPSPHQPLAGTIPPTPAPPFSVGLCVIPPVSVLALTLPSDSVIRLG